MAFPKLTLAFTLISVLLVFGMMQSGEACNLMCVQGAYIECRNYPNQQLYGCACTCAPKNGKDCVVYLPGGSTTIC
ncbi:hypothetical protein LUZ62_029924 [Rhynchospora pubera]|uniref:Uncharacterized protein n=1 Tax=Rhynchospora pubera TaxID=906938 RepID=A0AAV8HPV6_9POAL|nr:hypothetical protein LUZ62_029924 [Rhynchospora pubera]